MSVCTSLAFFAFELILCCTPLSSLLTLASRCPIGAHPDPQRARERSRLGAPLLAAQAPLPRPQGVLACRRCGRRTGVCVCVCE